MGFLITKNKNDNKYYQMKGEKIVLNNGYKIFITGEYDDININNTRCIIIGDCINTSNITFNESDFCFKLQGIYCCIFIDSFSVRIHSDFFSLYPIFYSDKCNCITSDYELFSNFNNLEISKSFILESVLFNYSFSNKTIFDQVLRLPSAHYLSIVNSSFSIKPFFNYLNYIPSSVKKLSTSGISDLASLFIDRVNEQTTNLKNFSVTFTSGFDGRSLVSCLSYLDRKFTTCSFGNANNIDLTMSLNQSATLGIHFNGYMPNNNYFENYYRFNAINLTNSSGGFNGFLYPHFPYLAYEENEFGSKALITGYGGSELFRALHIQGAIASPILYNAFLATNKSSIVKNILRSPRLLCLRLNLFKKELDILFDELCDYIFKFGKYLDINHKLYLYIYEEVFRKTFGSIAFLQMKYLKTRLPFLDSVFFKELTKTDLAGQNNSFFTHNPLKRYRGQLLYCEIIRQTNSSIFNFKTGKGYRPCDLMNLYGRIKLSVPYIIHKIQNTVNKKDLDTLGLISGLKMILPESLFLMMRSKYFSNQWINYQLRQVGPYMNEMDRDLLLFIISILRTFKYDY